MPWCNGLQLFEAICLNSMNEQSGRNGGITCPLYKERSPLRSDSRDGQAHHSESKQLAVLLGKQCAVRQLRTAGVSFRAQQESELVRTLLEGEPARAGQIVKGIQIRGSIPRTVIPSRSFRTVPTPSGVNPYRCISPYG